MPEAVIGLDLGTGGARALAVDPTGEILSEGRESLPPPSMDSEGRSEQDPESWERAVLSALAKCIRSLPPRTLIHAVCIDATSGTIVFLDHSHRPVAPGILHNDTRSARQATFLNDRLARHCREIGTTFGATFSLPKILRLKEVSPETFSQVSRICHQADFILGLLTGEYGVSDPSNAFKSGYHLIHESWPEEFEDLGIRPLMPAVRPSGSTVGTILPEIAAETGLSKDVIVLSGVTDSNAAFLASGAVLPGDCCNTLGTTLAFKAVSPEILHDPEGLLYCHRHPDGYWLPGAASNAGGACLKTFFSSSDLADLDRQVLDLFPCSHLCYPLVETGERFPFRNPSAEGFFADTASERERYLSLLQGVALVERWGMDSLRDLGVPKCNRVFATGSGSASDSWCQIRSDTLQVPLIRPACTESAFGVAILAASRCFYSNLSEASQKMIRIRREFLPHPGHAAWAEESLQALQAECRRRGLF